MKVKFCSIVGVIGSSIIAFVKKSKKGVLESEAGWRGLCRKGMILVFVLIGNRLDILLDTNYVMNTICIGYAMNELISIMENAGLMGIPLPAVVQGIIDVLLDENPKKKIK